MGITQYVITMMINPSSISLYAFEIFAILSVPLLHEMIAFIEIHQFQHFKYSFQKPKNPVLSTLPICKSIVRSSSVLLQTSL